MVSKLAGICTIRCERKRPRSCAEVVWHVRPFEITRRLFRRIKNTLVSCSVMDSTWVWVHSHPAIWFKVHHLCGTSRDLELLALSLIWPLYLPYFPFPELYWNRRHLLLLSVHCHLTDGFKRSHQRIQTDEGFAMSLFMEMCEYHPSSLNGKRPEQNYSRFRNETEYES